MSLVIACTKMKHELETVDRCSKGPQNLGVRGRQNSAWCTKEVPEAPKQNKENLSQKKMATELEAEQ